ncbi:radical SAM/SPASM domain-containing protein [Flavobacterium sp. FlaQc-48]|uniref:radical SAM protein n=1 Tax=Flavobacterium sp. FlaQc-48 TaxID=3374181 RepID=UPI003756D5F3
MTKVSNFLISAPLHVEMALSSSCQLSCNYCSAMPFNGKFADKESTLKLLNDLCDAKVFSLLLSGGEPTLHPNFFDFLKCVSGRISEITVNTNGIKFSHSKYAKEFNQHSPKATVAVSLDSADIKINDLQRGAGGSQAIRAIENLCNLNQPICISTVLTPGNLDTADKLIDRFFPSVKVFRFFPIVPRNELELKNNDESYQNSVKQFYKKISDRAKVIPELKGIVPYNTVKAEGQGSLFNEIDFCCCAFTKLFIDSELNGYPCYYSANTDTNLGNFKSNSFQSIWNSKKAFETRELSKCRSLCNLSWETERLPHKYTYCE